MQSLLFRFLSVETIIALALQVVESLIKDAAAKVKYRAILIKLADAINAAYRR